MKATDILQFLEALKCKAFQWLWAEFHTPRYTALPSSDVAPPRRGDQILLCGCGDEIHWIRVRGDGDDFATVTAPGGRKLYPKWVLLCPACQRQPGSAQDKATQELILDDDPDADRLPPPVSSFS